MKFEDVLPALRAGRKIHLTSDPTATIFTVADLLADDWEVVEEYEEITVWDWVVIPSIPEGVAILEGQSQNEIDHWRYTLRRGRVLGRIEESKRLEKRRKQ